MMKIVSVSMNLCRPKMLRFGSLLMSDFSVAQEMLSSKFEGVIRIPPKKRIKLLVTDPVFYGMPIQEQHKLVMDEIPESIRDEYEVETLTAAVDKLRHVQLKKDFIVDSNIDPVTPQMHLDASVMHFKNGDGDKASESAWLAVNLQLANLLSVYHLYGSDYYTLQNRIIYFLEQQCINDVELSSKFYIAWALVKLAYYNFYYNSIQLYTPQDDLPLESIWKSITAAEEFCNMLVSIYKKEYFNSFDLLKSLANESFYLVMLKVNYEIRNPNPQAKKLFYLKEILLMDEDDLIKFIENIPDKFKEDGSDLEILNFQLDEAKDWLNIIKEKRIKNCL